MGYVGHDWNEVSIVTVDESEGVDFLDLDGDASHQYKTMAVSMGVINVRAHMKEAASDHAKPALALAVRSQGKKGGEGESWKELATLAHTEREKIRLFVHDEMMIKACAGLTDSEKMSLGGMNRAQKAMFLDFGPEGEEFRKALKEKLPPRKVEIKKTVVVRTDDQGDKQQQQQQPHELVTSWDNAIQKPKAVVAADEAARTLMLRKAFLGLTREEHHTARLFFISTTSESDTDGIEGAARYDER
jgi:hypothetical protein